MNKKIICSLIFVLLLSTSTVFAAAKDSDKDSDKAVSSAFDKETVYYPNANLKSAISKYKRGNYSGCLQELFSLVKKDPSNSLAYYYMAMAFTHVDSQSEAIEAYEKVIALSPNSYLANFATKGRDCLTGGPACASTGAVETEDELDRFINAPYGNGLSEEVEKDMAKQRLNTLQKTINKKNNLEIEDVQKIREFDEKQQNSQSLEEENEKLAMVSDEEVLQAVKTLKEAGLNLTVQSDNPYSQMMQDPRMAEMSMLLGNNNNNNSNNMMNMLPMLMQKAEKGENIDPRFMQAMMMNSMMPDFNFSSDNRY